MTCLSQAGQYETLADLERDLDLCFRNAQTYNEPTSMLYKVSELRYDKCKYNNLWTVTIIGIIAGRK